MSTIEEVRKAFKEQLAGIAELDQARAAERKKIKVMAFKAGGGLKPEEIARCKEIAATRLELIEAQKVLALGTIDALEIADDVDDLLKEIGFINDQLEDDLKKLKTIEAYAEKVASFAASAEKLTQKLVELAAKLP